MDEKYQNQEKLHQNIKGILVTNNLKDISSEILLALSLGNIEKSYISVGSLLKAGAGCKDFNVRKEIMEAYYSFLNGSAYIPADERKSIRAAAFKNYLTALGFE